MSWTTDAPVPNSVYWLDEPPCILLFVDGEGGCRIVSEYGPTTRLIEWEHLVEEGWQRWHEPIARPE